MNTTKHTPGPWHCGSGKATVIIYTEKGDPIANAETYIKTFSLTTAQANAQLIAAAPCLLSILKKGLECGIFDNAPVFKSDVLTVVAKAEGMQS